ncbi:MAG: hypothetical protein K6G84_09310, partial [Lachnospiraceae bacterium]|nr:hypothetical protein [Lachnospiraceae bacterium]
MNTFTMLLPFIISGIGAIAFVFFWFFYIKRRKSHGAEFIKQKNRKNNFDWFLKLIKGTPGLAREYNRIKEKTNLLYPGSSVQADIEATKLLRNSLGILFGGIALTVFMAKGDIYFIGLGSFLSFVIFQAYISRSTRKIENNLIVQLGDFVSELISVYREHGGHLDDALYDMLVDLPYPINQHIEEVYKIITSYNPEEEATNYTERAANNFLLSFVSLAVPTVIYGDKTLDDGNTAFVKGLMKLKKQINEETLKRDRIDAAFASMEKVAIAPILLMKPLEHMFFLKNMPETEKYFTGVVGVSVITLIFLSAFVVLKVIDILRTFERPATKESDFFSELLDPNTHKKGVTKAKVGFAKTFALKANEVLNLFYSKHYTKCKKIEHNMEITGDRTGVKAHILKSLTVSLATCTLVVISFLFINVASVNTTLTNYKQTFQNVAVPDVTYTEEMENMAKTVALHHKGDYRSLSDEELKKEIRESTTVIKSDEYLNLVETAVKDAWAKSATIYFRWYYILIAMMAGAFAGLFPTWLLKYRAKTMLMQKEDEVNSFNLLAMIFMDMNSIQVSTLLEWMERFSYSYKPAIQECIVNMDMGQSAALQDLHDSDDLHSFQKFVRSMMAVDNMGFKKAFADIEIQQEYYNDKRKFDNE